MSEMIGLVATWLLLAHLASVAAGGLCQAPGHAYDEIHEHSRIDHDSLGHDAQGRLLTMATPNLSARPTRTTRSIRESLGPPLRALPATRGTESTRTTWTRSCSASCPPGSASIQRAPLRYSPGAPDSHPARTYFSRTHALSGE